MYLTYEEYKSYGGTLDETTFNDYAFEASMWVDWYTFGRLRDETEVDERVKRCVNKLVHLAKLKADALSLGAQSVTTTHADGRTTTVETSAVIASQSNDGVSISYNTMGASELYSLLKTGGDEGRNLIADTCYMYLDGVKNSLGQKVMYRGIYPNE